MPSTSPEPARAGGAGCLPQKAARLGWRSLSRPPPQASAADSASRGRRGTKRVGGDGRGWGQEDAQGLLQHLEASAACKRTFCSWRVDAAPGAGRQQKPTRVTKPGTVGGRAGGHRARSGAPWKPVITKLRFVIVELAGLHDASGVVGGRAGAVGGRAKRAGEAAERAAGTAAKEVASSMRRRRS